MTAFDIQKTLKVDENFKGNGNHDVFRLFDILPNFSFVASKMGQLLLLLVITKVCATYLTNC